MIFNNKRSALRIRTATRDGGKTWYSPPYCASTSTCNGAASSRHRAGASSYTVHTLRMAAIALVVCAALYPSTDSFGAAAAAGTDGVVPDAPPMQALGYGDGGAGGIAASDGEAVGSSEGSSVVEKVRSLFQWRGGAAEAPVANSAPIPYDDLYMMAPPPEKGKRASSSPSAHRRNTVVAQKKGNVAAVSSSKAKATNINAHNSAAANGPPVVVGGSTSTLSQGLLSGGLASPQTFVCFVAFAAAAVAILVYLRRLALERLGALRGNRPNTGSGRRQRKAVGDGAEEVGTCMGVGEVGYSSDGGALAEGPARALYDELPSAAEAEGSRVAFAAAVTVGKASAPRGAGSCSEANANGLIIAQKSTATTRSSGFISRLLAMTPSRSALKGGSGRRGRRGEVGACVSASEGDSALGEGYVTVGGEDALVPSDG